jgi:hypothetical protein
MLEGHCHGKDKNQPSHSYAEQTSVVEVQIYCADQHASRKIAGDDGAYHEDQHSSEHIGDVGEDAAREQGRPLGIERGDSNEKPGNDDQRGDRSGYQEGGALQQRPLRGGVKAPLGEALVKLHAGEHAANDHGKKKAQCD